MVALMSNVTIMVSNSLGPVWLTGQLSLYYITKRCMYAPAITVWERRRALQSFV